MRFLVNRRQLPLNASGATTAGQSLNFTSGDISGLRFYSKYVLGSFLVGDAYIRVPAQPGQRRGARSQWPPISRLQIGQDGKGERNGLLPHLPGFV